MQVLLVLFSSVLLSLSLPNELFPFGLGVLGLAALVPAFLAIHRASSRIAASRLGALFGGVSTLISNYWLAFFGEFSIWTIGGTVVAYTGFNYILFGYLHFLMHRESRHGRLASELYDEPPPTFRPVLIAVAWTGYEYLKSVGFLGYPWGLVAYPVSFLGPVAQLAEITGPWGLSFIGAYMNAAIAEVIVFFPKTQRFTVNRPGKTIPGASVHILAGAAFLAVAAFFGLVRLPAIEAERSINLLLVQQNVDSWHPGRFADALGRAQELTIEGMTDGDSPRPEAIIWSETSLRVPYSPGEDYYLREPDGLPFHYFLRLLDTPLVTGTAQPVPGTQDYTNSAVVIRPDGTITGSYGKQQLVPFAENIPFWDVPLVQKFFRSVVGLSGTWVPGKESRVLALPLSRGREITIGTPICFEDAFGWVPREMVRNGAEVLVNLTNNSWSRQESAQTQHFAAARLRTIELRTTLVRGTNSGLSGVIDARGTLVEELPMFVGTSSVVSVPLYGESWTLYRSWGDWFGILSVGLTMVVVWRLYRRRNDRTIIG